MQLEVGHVWLFALSPSPSNLITGVSWSLATLSSPSSLLPPSSRLTFPFPSGFWLFLGMAGQYKQPVQYGKGTPIKAGQPEPAPHLGTTCEIHHIYEDLNESSSARPGGSQQLEIPPSLNSKRAACFSSPAGFSSKRWFFTRRRDFNAHNDSIVRLFLL